LVHDSELEHTDSFQPDKVFENEHPHIRPRDPSHDIANIPHLHDGQYTDFVFTACDGSNVWEIKFRVPNESTTTTARIDGPAPAGAPQVVRDDTGAEIGQVYNDDDTSCHAVLIFNSDKITTAGGGRESEDEAYEPAHMRIPVEPGRAQWHVEQVDDLNFFNIDRCNGVENEDSSWPVVFEEQSSSSGSDTCISGDAVGMVLIFQDEANPVYSPLGTSAWDEDVAYWGDTVELICAPEYTQLCQVWENGETVAPTEATSVCKPDARDLPDGWTWDDLVRYPTEAQCKAVYDSAKGGAGVADPSGLVLLGVDISGSMTESTLGSGYSAFKEYLTSIGVEWKQILFNHERWVQLTTDNYIATVASFSSPTQIVVDWVDGYNCELAASSGSLELVVAAGLGAGTSPDYGDTGACSSLSGDANVLDDAVRVINGVPPVNGDIPLATSPEIGIQRSRGLIELVIR
jgi:hypothetical protein